MDEEVSWQKLVGIPARIDDAPVSPVFHKNKWVIIQKSKTVKEASSGQPADKIQTSDNPSQGCEFSDHQISSVSTGIKRKVKPNDELIHTKNVKKESLGNTPTRKTKSSKRKLADHPLVGLTPSPVDQFNKRCKLLPSSAKEEKQITTTNDIVDVEKKVPAVDNVNTESHFNGMCHLQFTNSSDKSCNKLNKIKRNILYSNNIPANNIPTENSLGPKEVTISDIYKSIIMLEEADKITSLKGGRSLKFNELPEDFISVSNLQEKFRDPNCTESGDDKAKILKETGKENSERKQTLTNETSLLNDSLSNFQFTEVEESYHPSTRIQVKNNEMGEHSYPKECENGGVLKGEELCASVSVRNNTSGQKFKHNLSEKPSNLPTVRKIAGFYSSDSFEELHKNLLSSRLEDTLMHHNQGVMNNQRDSFESEIKPGPSGRCRSDIDLLNVRSKFENGQQDSINFDDFSTQTNKLEQRTPSHTDIFDQKSSHKNVSQFQPELNTSDLDKTLLQPVVVPMRGIKQKLSKLSSISEGQFDHSIVRICNNKINVSFSSDTEVETESKEKVELLLQDFMDQKPVHLNSADLSVDYSFGPSTLVQFSTASGCVVRASELSLNKAKGLMKDVLDEENAALNKIKIDDQYRTSADSFCFNDPQDKKEKKHLTAAEGDKTEMILNIKPDNYENVLNYTHNPIPTTNESFVKALGERPNKTVTSVNDIMDQVDNIDCISKLSSEVKVSPTSIYGDDNKKNIGQREECDALLNKIPEENSNLNSACFHEMPGCSNSNPTLLLKMVKPFKTFSTASGTTVEASCRSVDKIRTLFKDFIEDENSIENTGYESPGNSDNAPRKGNGVAVGAECTSLSLASLHKNEKAVVHTDNLKTNPPLALEELASLNLSNKHTNFGELDLPNGVSNEGTSSGKIESSRSTEKCIDLSSQTVLMSSHCGNATCHELSLAEKSNAPPTHHKLLEKNIPARIEKENGNELNQTNCVEHHFAEATNPNEMGFISLSAQNGNTFNFSTAAGGSVAISEESLKTVKAMMNEDSLFNESKEESYNFSSLGEDTILLIKEGKSKVEFNVLSEITSDSSKQFKKGSLSEKCPDLIEKQILSQNTSVFESLQFTPYNNKNPTDSKLECIPKSSADEAASKVSEKHLCKKESLVSEKIIDHTSSHGYLISDEMPCAFSNARGNKIVISENSLQKIKHQFKDILDADDDCKSEVLLKPVNAELPCKKIKNANENSQEKECRLVVEFRDESSLNDKLVSEKLVNIQKINETSNTLKLPLSSPPWGNAANMPEISLQKTKCHLKDELDGSVSKNKNCSSGKFSEEDLPQIKDFSFLTAKGSKINVSEESLRKVKMKFKDDLDIIDFSFGSIVDKSVSQNPVITARSSENKTLEEEHLWNVKIPSENVSIESESENSVQKPKQKERLSFSTSKRNDEKQYKGNVPKNKTVTMENLNINLAGIQSNPRETVSKNLASLRQDCSITSARAGKISVSKECSSEVTKKFKEFECKELKAENITFSEPKQSKSVLSFSTALGSAVTVSEESLQKVKQQFIEGLEEEDFNFSQLFRDDVIKTSRNNYAFSFSTALGGSINVSEGSLKKVKEQFKNELDLEVESGDVNKPLQNKNALPFSTALGGSIKVSEESLKKVKEQFKNELDFEVESGDVNKPLQNKNALPFSTALGGSIKVSEESLKKVKEQFKNELDFEVESGDVNKPLQNKNALPFSTALGGSIKVSEESLKKVKEQFKNELDFEVESGDVNKPLQNKNALPFSTALGGSIKVSEESLKKVKEQFKNELDFEVESGDVNKPLQNKNALPFSTALGGSIKVSEESLKKVKEQFKNEIDLEEESGDVIKPSNKKNALSFSTALGGSIKVSEESLKKVKEQFKNELDLEVESGDVIKPLQNKNAFSFSTALGGSIKVSEESLKKVKEQFKDELELVVQSGEVNKPLQNKNALPFSTALGGSIKVSEESLKKVKEQFKNELDFEVESGDVNKPLQNKNALPFSTALGGSIKVSEESLKKVKEQFKNELDFEVESGDVNKPLQNKNALPFSTALGGSIKVSEESLKKVKEQFKNELDFEVESGDVNKPLQNKNAFSFSTALGGSIKVSEESLKKVKEQFKNELDFEVESGDVNKPLQNKNAFSFSTALGGSIKVSEESLKKVKEQFKNELDFEVESGDVNKPLQNKNAFSFSTALGGSIKVSEESLKKVKEQFKNELDFEVESGDVNKPLQNKNAFSFSTALGGSIKVSEESLKKVKEQFKNELDLEVESGDVNKPLQNKNAFSFSTALGGSIKVSEESLKKVKEQFKNELDLEVETGDVNKSLQSKNAFSFSTALGGSIKVSEESLKKVKEQFKNELDLEVESGDVNKPLQNKNAFSFSTALGGSIKVSEESLKKVKEQFKNELDLEELSLGDLELLEPSHSKQSFSFSTSLGDAVSGSEKSLMNVTKQFEDEIKKVNSHNVVKPCQKGLNLISLSPQESTVVVYNECLLKSKTQLSLDYEDAKSVFNSPTKSIPLGGLKSSLHPHNDDPHKSEMLMDFTQSLDGAIFDAEMNRLEESLNKNKVNSFSRNNENNKTVSKSPGSVNSCLIFNEGEKEGLPTNKHESFTITQNIKGSFQNEKLSQVKENLKKERRAPIFLKDKFDSTYHTKENPNGFPKVITQPDFLDSGTINEDSFILHEVADSAAALIQDSEGFCGKPFITSPSSVCSRNKLKPITSWSLEFGNDDDILAAAETPKKLECFDSNSIGTELVNTSLKEKRKSDCVSYLQPVTKKCKLNDDQIENNTDLNEIITIRQIRREEQRTMISNKKTASISPGLYMSIRSNQVLMKFMDSPLNNPHSLTEKELLERGLLENVINITSKNAIDFQFIAHHYFSQEECFSTGGVINIGSGFNIVLTDENKIGLEEISSSFLCHPNVDPSIVPQNWIKNHYRWIIWKLASLEKSFPHVVSGRFLLPINVLHQLKYRYDRELDHAQRSALRRILECDSPASRRFIACIADMRKVERDELESSTEVELTDGWYSVWSTVDPALENLIKKNKIKIGTKLIIHGAELLNCADGYDPLELKETVRLKLHTNSLRRVKWCAKMGFTRCPGPIGISLDSIMPNGGLVGLTTGVVARVYPMLYMSRDSSGKSVIRNSQAESHIAAIKEKERNLKSEELYEKILNEVQGKYKKKSPGKYDLKNIKQITDPEVLWRIVSNESDPTEVHSMLNSDQLEGLRKYHEEITVKIRDEVNRVLKEKLEDLIPLRKVTNLLKVRLADPLTELSAIVTIWRPTEDVCNLLSENKCIDFFALNSCGTREKVLQLANMKYSCYKESTLFTQTNKFQRKLTDIADLIYHETFPMFGELDVVGIVVYVQEPEKPWGVTNVYLSDIRNNFLMITFWTSLKTFGFEDLLREGSVVAAINLHRRQGSGSYVVPSTFANEVTYFSSNPSQKYLSQEVETVRNFLSEKDLNSFLQSRKEILLSLVKERNCNVTPVRSREGGVSKRLDLLKSYGPASPLPKVPLVSSPDIHKRFRSPKISRRTPNNSTINS